MSHFLALFEPYIRGVTILVGGVILALLAHKVLFYLARQIVLRTRSPFQESLIRHSRQPARLILPLIAAFLVTPSLSLSPAIGVYVERLFTLGLIASVAWLVARLTSVVVDLADARYKRDVLEDLRARKIHTQVQVLRRITVVGIVIFAGSLMLMTFPTVRHIGITIFASAGVAGVVAGMAARSTFANLLAGVQIALTEPIRLEDVVIVEGEWGRIEEIGTTYIVVRIWDLRRLVVPLSYFIEKPFQNWTRTSTNLLGTVFIYADYTVRVEDVRTELHRILQDSGMWDGKVWGLQVTNASEHTLELRALMSAPDSNNAWDLRCHVREKLIAFLQQRYPQSLPRVRADVSGVPSAAT
jgi:small-conductance mechanosensitive channel